MHHSKTSLLTIHHNGDHPPSQTSANGNMDECKNTPKIHYLHTSTPHQGNNGIAREEEKPHYRDRGKAAKRGFKPTDHRLNQQLVSSKAVAFQGPAAVMVAEKLGFGDGAGINSRE